VPDTTAPSIRALSYTPTAVDTFTLAATITVTVQIADDLAGVQGGCIATFYSPSGTQYAQVCVNTSDRISGTAQDGVYRVTITIPRYAEAGTWHLHGGALVDVVGNLRRYTETEFAQLGFLTTLSVIGNVPPIADAGADASVEVGASVVLNGFGSYDPEGGTLRYEWMEGAGILLGTAATISVQATLGSKAYTLRVTDAVGLTGLDSVVITGVDTTPPVLILPGSITVDATSPTGAAVTYIVTVSDNADSSPSVECRPPSGTIFPLGATAVRCSASDATGNTSTDTFQITVRGATEQALNLTTFVQALNLKQGISSSLDAKLQNIRAALAATTAGDRVTACNMLSAFVKEVQAQIGKTLTEVEANDLIAAARRIQVLLGC
jgi:hypothetical protein